MQPAPAAPAAPDPQHPSASRHAPTWVAAWATAPMGSGTATDTPAARGFEDQTIRTVVRVSAGGDAVRFEVSNAYGDRALHVGSATVATHDGDGAIDPGSLRTATFSGHRTVTVPPGASVISDPVEVRTRAGDELAISIHLPTATGPATWHKNTQATSYISGPGDHTGDPTAAAFTPTTSKFFVTEVAVRGARVRGTVVTLGDSITEGYKSSTDAHHSYPDFLARRLQDGPRGRRMSVVNEGIGGNRLLSSVWGGTKAHESGQARFVRDVVARSGVRTVLVLFGTNDLIRGNADGEPTTALDLVRGTQSLITRAHRHDIRIVVGTVPPMGGSSVFSERVEENRRDFNRWVRRSGEPDGVADFDKALRDRDDPTRIAENLHSGDHVHPSDAGYRAMARQVDVRRLARPPSAMTDPRYVSVEEAAGPGLVVGTGRPAAVSVTMTNHDDRRHTVTVTLRTPRGWESDPVTTTLGPNRSTTVEVPVEPPAEPAAARLMVDVTAERNGLVLGHPVADVVTTLKPDDASLAIDAGPANSPVLPGYAGLQPDDAFTPDAGYGWIGDVEALDARDRDGPDALRRDFLFSKQPATLRLRVPPGQHRYYALAGDANFAAGDVRISENGVELASNDHELGLGEFTWLAFTLDGGDDGRLADLQFANPASGNWRLNALVVPSG